MSTLYEFKGVNIATGRREYGTLESDGDEHDVYEELVRKGIEAPHIRPYNAQNSQLPRFVNVKTEDHLHFFEQMAFLKTLVLSRAVKICAERCTNRRFGITLDQIAKDVADGKELHTAMAKHPRSFTPLMIALVRAAHDAGAGDEIYQNLADMLEFEYSTKTDIWDGLRGPAVLAVFGIIAIVVMFTFFVPRIASLLNMFHVQMPLITVIILRVGAILSQPLLWITLGALTLVGTVSFLTAMRNVRFALAFDHFVRAIKPIGPLLEKRDTATIARTLSVILKTVNLGHGVTLLVPMARTTLHRLALEEVVNLVQNEGVELAEAFEQAGGFDDLFVSYLAIGAESTERPAACLRVAQFLEREVRRGFKSLTSKIDPAVSLLFTGAFLTVSVGLYMAYLQLISQALNNF